jgi:GNAT superfamily N-acetyltransferase
MLKAALVRSEEELLQIHQLNQQNLKSNLDARVQQSEGFVTWLYSLTLLKQMHHLSPSVVIKDGNKVVAYALTTLKESRLFHADLEIMFRNLENARYQDRPLSSYNFYCMGQICVAREYRGKGLVSLLYQKHKEEYGSQFDFLLTEISTSNARSLKAHEKTGFKSIYTYSDAMDEWSVVLWEWR